MQSYQSDSDSYDVGIEFPPPDRGRADGLTTEDIEWAIEQGATSEDEIFKLVKEHKEQVEWQQ